ncbi:inhibitor of Bruton tyrosine kinase isoform X2 [Stigmatopora argus]
MSLVLPDCTPKCRSLQHANEVVAAITSGSEGQLRAFLTSHCHNATILRDEFGRTALHLAASLGKQALLEWLLESKNADLTVKDKESGWTALHRSVFYGQIHCLISLVKHGGVLSTQDKEGLSTVDLIMKDRPHHVVFENADPTEVYTWGNNSNFSLGHGNQDSRQHPELVDFFTRTGVYVKQVVLCKFHSVFLSQKGQVFTCGHGQGGRLGHGDEQTYLVPQMVEGLRSHRCSQVAAAKDHTVVLTEEGYVYTFGLNTFHQLGLTPPPASAHVPKQVFSKILRGRAIIGVAAGRFHTVLWTRDAVYTMGLNGGQLGYLLDPNGQKCVTAPRQVCALHHKDVTIAMAAASGGATVIVTEKGDVYLLADYQCKKIASRQLNIKKILVNGGNLDHRVNPQILNECGGEKVSILALDEAGRVFCWRSLGSSVRQCRWVYGRQVFMSDIALSKNAMMFVTKEGEGFSGMWAGEYKKYSDKKEINVEVCGHSDAGTIIERIRLEKLTHIHRAVSITMDSNGRNFGLLQVDPKTSLYEIPSISPSSFATHFQRFLGEADEMDSIHDVTLQAGNRTFAAHKYILSMRSEFFRKQFVAEQCGIVEELDKEVRKSEDAVGCDLFIFETIPPDMLEYALQFIYTDNCELLVHGAQHKQHSSWIEQKEDSKKQSVVNSLRGLNLRGSSALELPLAAKGDCNKLTSKGSKPGKKGKGKGPSDVGSNPVKTLQVVAKKLGLCSLSSRLDGVKYEGGKIHVMDKKTANQLRFNQMKCAYLCDVTLKSVDGKEFPCHKSVLCARQEYFYSMLGNPWIESTSCSALKMPTTSDVLQAILEYIYTDDSPSTRESMNVAFVCNVLIVADQLLILRLKEICEVAITENLTLKNAAELLEFSAMYNAEQLKLSCLQFIVLNLGALLETKALDCISDEVLLDLSASYRRMIPAMQRRVFTPYPDAPDLSLYDDEDINVAFSPKLESELGQSNREVLLRKAKMKAKKKPRRRSDSSGGYTLSDIILSPPPSVSPCLVKTGKGTSTESLQELLTSDSEGSCMGPGSPRDMPSPNFQEKAVEEKVFYQKVVSPPNSFTKNGLPTPPNSSPKDIPKSLHSPSHPPPVLDFRAIMDMEANSLQTLRAPPKSPASVLPLSKHSTASTKLSQKQRKKLSLASKENSVEFTALKSTPIDTPSKNSSGKTWALALQSSPSSCSFRELMKEEENLLTRVGQAGTPKIHRAQASPVTVTPVNRKVTFKCAEGIELEKPGPWMMAAVGSPPLPPLVTFASIVEEERQQEAALIRSREKPLALIQIEERAIQDLLFHYKAHDNPDEMILVERASSGPMAAPIWNKH